MKVIVDGLAVEYLDEGQGPVLLLLHGWGNTMRYFDPLCAELSGMRLVRLDLPGFGGTQQPAGDWTVEDYVRFVGAFCKKLAIAPAYMLGHSFGGRILIKGAGEGVLHPQKLILIGSAGVAERRTLRNGLYALLAKIGKILLRPLPAGLYARLRRTLYERSGSDYLQSGAMAGTFLSVIKEDLSGYAARIEVPALLIWGARDEATPLAEGKRLQALIKDSALRVIPDAGHFAYRERPAETARMIEAYIA
jgi:pimeloyl-ACP methyl ester carboxylesterase